MTDEWSNTGNNSIKITPIDPTGSVWIRIKHNSPNITIDTTFTGKIYVKCVNCSGKLTSQIGYIEPVEGATSKSKNVTIPADTIGVITLSDTVDSNTEYIQLQLNMQDIQADSVMYLDTLEMLL